MSEAMPSRMAREGRTAALGSSGHHSPSERRDVLPWPDVGDDDSATIELDALKDARRVREVRGACDRLLADLKQFEGWPALMANPDIDRKHTPLRAAGAPEKISLPNGLEWGTVLRGVGIIDEWEIKADGTATDLFLELYNMLVSATSNLTEES
jgi:hypothetical protein